MTDALNAAKALGAEASQEEVDAAVKALNDAVAALEKKADTQDPDDTKKPGGTTLKPDDTKKPGSSQNTGNTPGTGDPTQVLPYVLLIAAGCGAVIVLVRKRAAVNR